MTLDRITGRHTGIKILLMQNMGDAHYLAAVRNTFYPIVISVRLERSCYQVFAAHMPVCQLNRRIINLARKYEPLRFVIPRLDRGIHPSTGSG